jgi:hypothetical protein
MFGRYGLSKLLRDFRDNHLLIRAYLRGYPVEGFNTKLLAGGSVSSFLLILLTIICIWTWAGAILVSRWSRMPVWARIFGVMTQLTGLAPFTLFIVYGSS